MHLHEYQAKEVLQKYGIPVPYAFVINSIEELEKAPKHSEEAVLKIQVHAGGRGKGGGVRIAKSKAEQIKMAKEMLGMKLVNSQTGPKGLIAQQVLISEPVKIQKEYYLGIIADRAQACPVLIASPEGGMDIEEVAHKTPEKILKLSLPLNGKIRSYHQWQIVKFLGLPKEVQEQGMSLVRNLAKAFVATDALLMEINPLVLTEQNNLIALDAKLTVDDNALFRQKEIDSYFDPTQVSPSEVWARQYDLAYVDLDGEIGCMVNGAGLAMATMDIIQHYGGSPANFLDVGGSATEERVAEGFKIILSDPNVKAILVNIFGGIMNCQTLAAGIIAACKQLKIHVPLVVRMEGTHVDQGKRLLSESKLPILLANNLDEAAQKVVEAAKG